MRSEVIEAVSANGRALRVEFEWRGDRYGQVISAVDADGIEQKLLESIEGTAADDWPPSPPLQSLSIERLPDGRQVALLVGMAGGGHWSASVEPVAGQAELIVDVACRCSGAPARLGSRYRRLSEAAKELSIRGEGVTVTDGEEIAATPAVSKSPKPTVRWKFVISLS